MLHGFHDAAQCDGRVGIYNIIRRSVEDVEEVVFERQAAGVLLVVHEVGAHLDGHSAVALFVVEVVYLPRSEEEDGAWLHLIIGEIHGVDAFALLEPEYFVEGMDVWRAVVDVAAHQEVWHVPDAETVAAGSRTYGLVTSFKLFRVHIHCFRMYHKVRSLMVDFGIKLE